MTDTLPGDEAAQAAALVTARRRATLLLAFVAVAFLATFALPDGGATPWLRAALEAGMVGGLADWFAVVALFRHPLGIPIPHTAVIPKSKDGLGANLSTFVEQNFLGSEQLDDRLRDPAHVVKLGSWLAAPANADRVATELARVAGAVLGALDEDDLVDRVVAGVRSRLAKVPVSRLAGASLETAITEHRHRELVTATLHGVRDGIASNRTSLRRRLGEQSPAWVPPALDDLVFDRAEGVARTFLTQLAKEEDHELRRSLDEQLLALTRRMQSDPDVRARVDAAVQDAVTDEMLGRWVRSWLDALRQRLARAGDPSIPSDALRTMAVDGLTTFGARLQDDAADVHVRMVAALTGAAPTLAGWARREVGGLIEATIDRWDAEDTSRRLELWLGRDLQFVRINGTLVGALVGVVLHAITEVLA